MKTAGLIGGIGPESTVDYYRLIVSLYRERHPSGNYPCLVINSIDLKHCVELTGSDRGGLVDFIGDSLEVLHRAGADFGAVLSNTPHVVFDELRERSAMPLISIVEVARERARQLGLTRLALFGTQTTMTADTYRKPFAARGIDIVAPNETERAFIHDKYFGELVEGKIVEATRVRLVEIARSMAERDGADGLILGGTELSLILRGDTDVGMPILDTTRIHAECIVDEMF